MRGVVTSFLAGVWTMAGCGMARDHWLGSPPPSHREHSLETENRALHLSVRLLAEENAGMAARLRGERFGAVPTRPWVPPVPLSWEPAPRPEAEPERIPPQQIPVPDQMPGLFIVPVRD